MSRADRQVARTNRPPELPCPKCGKLLPGPFIPHPEQLGVLLTQCPPERCGLDFKLTPKRKPGLGARVRAWADRLRRA